MEKKIFSVKDSQTGIYNPPFYQHTHAEAERTVQGLLTDERSLPAQFPEHFDLYYLGIFDDNTGKIESLDTPQHVIKLDQLVRSTSLEKN